MRRFFAIVISGLLALMSLPLATPAQADGPTQAGANYLQLDKSVSPTGTLEPGETFTYQLVLNCGEADCVDANLSDAFPAELDGFPIIDAQFTPSATTIPRQISWSTTSGGAKPATLTKDTVLSVDLNKPLAGGGKGMEVGQTFTVLITLKVPTNYPPGNSGDIVNKANATASNANAVSDQATIVIESPVKMGVDAAKKWSPATQSFQVGAESTISLGATNASNVGVKTLTVQEPKNAADGASALDPSNPFTITDFAGLDSVSLPAGCDNVQVDAYVKDGATWKWKAGVPAAAAALPNGVSNADVGGIRVTCISDSADGIKPGSGVSFDLDLEQRATGRNDDADLSKGQHKVDNTASATAARPDQDPATDDASASHTVTPVVPTVDAAKSISPDTITAGANSAATLTTTNGHQPVASMTTSDLDFFNDNIKFGGFTSAPQWPEGADKATITYYLPGGDPVTVAFINGDTPEHPANITGFSITYTGTLIAADTSATAAFAIGTSVDATAGKDSVTVTNTVKAEVVAANGQKADDSASDDLTIIKPDIDVTLDKTVRPSNAVYRGDSVVASLESTATIKGDGAKSHDISVVDRDNDFWNAFNLKSIAPTQVPAGTAMTITVFDKNGGSHTLDVAPARGAAWIYQLSADALQVKLAAAGLPADDITGIGFDFANAEGFPQKTTVTPNVVYEARSELRNGGPVTDGPYQPKSYENTAVTEARGKSQGGADLEDQATDSSKGTIITDETGPGPVDIRKAWDKDQLASQSGDTASTKLSWNVESGYSPVTIDDAADSWATPKDTVFDAFDLLAVRPIDPSADPFSNGWWLKYDSVTSVQLYYDGSWHAASGTPADGWMTADRGFKGYTLSADESAKTTGVRLVFEETAADKQARQQAAQPGAGFDPFAPVGGSGVGAGSARRTVDLDWQLRNVKRSGGWATADTTFNTSDKGVIDNTTQSTGKPMNGGDDVTDRHNDTISLVDQEPGVNVEKAVDSTKIQVPVAGTSPEDYPKATWSIEAHNSSTSQASFVRVTDPAQCPVTATPNPVECHSAGTKDGALGDPFDTSFDHLTGDHPTPFERFDATKVTIGASLPDEVDLAATKVWLLHYDAAAKTYSTTETTAAAVNAMIPAQLADVVGISVTFQGTDPTVSGGTISQANKLTISIESILRSTLRSSGEPQTLAANQTVDVTNRVFAQSYDPVLADGTQTGDSSSAPTVLGGGSLDIVATKAIDPESLTEPQRGAPVNVTLGANQGSSTLAPTKVVIEDQSKAAEFFKTFAFDKLGAVTLPLGADRVQVDAYVNGAWLTGSPAAQAALPHLGGATTADIQGIRFTFTRADGAAFQSKIPADKWTASAAFSVKARDTYYGTTDRVVFDGTSVEDTQTSQSARGDVKADAEASDSIQLINGTAELAVKKVANDANRFVTPGSPFPYTLTFKNVGSGYLTLSDLTDTLPDKVSYVPTPAPVYTKDSDGRLSDKVVEHVDGQKLTFTWPDDGNVMKPGESFTITFMAELLPGLPNGERATNTMVVSTQEELAGCRPIDEGGSTTDDFQSNNKTCGTTDYVQTAKGPNLYTVKGVAGALEGADKECATFDVDGKSYYRSPCAANSLVEGVDSWALRSVNGGTVGINDMTVFDQLPFKGDTFLISGGTRGSEFRPALVADSLKVAAPEGTVQTIEATTTTAACAGTWATLTTQPVCEQNGETWKPLSEIEDQSLITGIRVHLDFTKTATGLLQPGQGVDVTFQTKNTVAGEANPGGASAVVPSGDQYAWNQFGVKLKYDGESTYRKVAPAQVGTHLLEGAIKVVKKVEGAAAGYAPDSFKADVSCTTGDGAKLDLGDQSTVTLTKADSFTARIDGIPLSAKGTTCVVTEQGATGEFGETSRSGSPATVTVDQVVAGDAEVPASQTASITNTYDFTGLSVTKQVSTLAKDVAFGPFDFELSCTSITGQKVTFDDEGTTAVDFTLKDKETWTAPANRIPVGATCALTEVNSSHADSIVFTGDNVKPGAEAGSAVVTPGIEPAHVDVTNAYDAGVFTLAKKVDGEGAGLYGTGQFSFDVECTYQEQTPLKESVQLRGGETMTFGPYPAGTTCKAVETKTAGATASVIEPANGEVKIVGPEEGQSVGEVSVTAVNTFDLTSFDVVKVINGNSALPGTAGPFKVEASCTWLVDGERVAFDVPDGGARELNAANGFTASYDNLPSSAVCQLTETDNNGADSTAILTTIGEDKTAVSGNAAEVDLSTTTGPGQATATITNTFISTQIDVEKKVEGLLTSPGATGPFPVSLSCTWNKNGQVLPLEVPGGADRELSSENQYKASYENLPTSSICTLTEKDPRGADHTGVTVELDGQKTATDGTSATIDMSKAGDSHLALATVTNVFDATSLEVVKKVEGNRKAPGAAGPFQVELSCTVDRAGKPVDVEIPGGASRELGSSNGFATTYGDLPSGSKCSLKETNTGGAQSTSIQLDVNGKKTSVDSATAAVDLSGTTEPGQAKATVINRFPVPKPPHTGGMGEPVAWGSALVLLLLGAGAVLTLRRRALQ